MEGAHLVDYLVDREHQMVWVVEAEVAALLETGTVWLDLMTFPALVAMVEWAVVQRPALMPTFAVKSVPVWR